MKGKTPLAHLSLSLSRLLNNYTRELSGIELYISSCKPQRAGGASEHRHKFKREAKGQRSRVDLAIAKGRLVAVVLGARRVSYRLALFANCKHHMGQSHVCTVAVTLYAHRGDVP